MMISKHHYALNFARRGNKVFFINPPNDPEPREKLELKNSGVEDNLLIISQKLFFPYSLKFHAMPVYHWLMQWQIRKIIELTGPPDIVWSFDIGYIYPLKYFPDSAIKVFHPVDEPTDKISIEAANGADVIFSVTREILDKYQHLTIPRFFVNHGLTREFLEVAESQGLPHTGVRIGFSGNLMREDLDRETLIEIVRGNPDIKFEFWGTFHGKDSNLGESISPSFKTFINGLQDCPNVILHGPVSSEALASGYGNMDGFLICYDIQKDQSHGTNYHKIMEFLSTGKVIISNNVTTYQNYPDLLVMTTDRQSNRELPEIFRNVVGNIGKYNDPKIQEKRRNFAKDNTYSNQVERIDTYLATLPHKPH
jgi:hypothetical protein